MLKDLIAYLYRKYCPQPVVAEVKPDIVAMTREHFKLIGTFVEEDTEEKHEMFIEAKEILKGRAFKYIIKKLTDEQKDQTMNNAESWENALAGRLNVNGFALVLEQMQSFATQVQEKEAAIEPYSAL